MADRRRSRRAGQSRELLETARPEEIAELQAHDAPVAAISDEFWYPQRFGGEPVYVLQVVAVAPQLKSSSAFRRLIDPVISACDAAGVPMVPQTRNPANTRCACTSASSSSGKCARRRSS